MFLMRLAVRGCRGWVSALVLCCWAAAAPAQRPAVTDADVDQAIANAVKMILAGQVDHWTLGYFKNKPRPVPRNGSILDQVTRVTGELVKESRRGIRFKTSDGQVLDVPIDRVFRLDDPGHFEAEYAYWGSHGSRYQCGPSALLTLSLLYAGLTDAHPQVKQALKYLGNDPERWPNGRRIPATYSNGLRASVWAHLAVRAANPVLRSRYRRLLQHDAQWLCEAIHESGWYTYTGQEKPDRWRPKPNTKDRAGDHSNTQIGILGVWSAANANIELPNWYWKLVEQHWLETQVDNGGWTYGVPGRKGDDGRLIPPKVTMTTAGLNCMYVCLDKLHALGSGRYVRFNGVRYNARALAAIARDFKSIDAGLAWMDQNLKNVPAGYGAYGLERLGVASGLKEIGGHDWYKDGAARIAPRYLRSGDAVGNVNDAFQLMFLTYGRAPVLFNKLAYGDQTDWNYYFRDLHYLCRYMSRVFERLYKWQILEPESDLHDWHDAPFVYLSGTKTFSLPEAHLAKLRQYCEEGGTIIAHTDLRESEFLTSFMDAMMKLYADRGYEFRKLPNDHPIYTAHFGSGRNRWQMHVPLMGMSNGVREFIILFPVDVAGAWHQNLESTHRDMFRLMVNIRMYGAPAWKDLPGRLRPKALDGSPAAPTKTLRIARIKHTGGWHTVPAAWQVIGRRLCHRHGITINELEPIDLKSPVDAAGVDVLHLAGTRAFELDADQIANLKSYLDAGGFVWADAIAGREAFDASMQALLPKLSDSTPAPLGPSHGVLTGGAGPIEEVLSTKEAIKKRLGSRLPHVAIHRGDKLVLLYSPLDVTAAMAGHFVWESVGYQPPTARHLIANVLLWRAGAAGS